MTDSALIHATEQIRQAQQSIPVIQSFFDQATYTVTYVVHDAATKCAAITASLILIRPPDGRPSIPPMR